MTATLILPCTASAPIGCALRFVAVGCSPATSAAVYRVNSSSGVTNDASFSPPITPDAAGNAFWSITNAIASGDDYVIHQPAAANKLNRFSNIATVTWTSPAGACPTWNPTVPTLTATPGSNEIALNWVPATVCDPSVGYVDYTIRRDTSSPPTTVIASGLLGLTYVDTGRVPGVTYFYKVTATWQFSPTLGSFGGTTDSNIASATPRVRREAWGRIAR